MFTFTQENAAALFNVFLDVTRRSGHVLTNRMAYDAVAAPLISSPQPTDYVRWRSLQLMAELIEARKLEGAVAEAGVWKGWFSLLINTVFPRRTLHLFDTFEGFDRKQIDDEVKAGAIDSYFQEKMTFADTSVDAVVSRLPHKENCVVHKGLFEETAPLVDEKSFVFVSLDMDLKAPMRAALEWFWPRMVPGGAVYLHDFNHRMIRGVREVISEFEAAHGFTPKFPLPDEGGTIVLLKA